MGIYQISIFNSVHVNTLSNLVIHSPCIIQIIHGKKCLFLNSGQKKYISKLQLLLCEVSTSLNFKNIPENSQFSSRVFTFNHICNESMLKVSQIRRGTIKGNIIDLDKGVEDILNALASINVHNLSEKSQIYLVMGLYQRLAEKGVLHLLFPNTFITLKQKVNCFLSVKPDYCHTLENTANYFGMSRSTLIRRLKQENTKFRDLLIDVRLNHALTIIQNGCYNTAILAQMCGYQSEEKFSSRFKDKFGVTISRYIKQMKL